MTNAGIIPDPGRKDHPVTPPAPVRPGPLRLEAQFPSGRGFRRRFRDWAEAAAFLASPDFTEAAPFVKAVTIVRTAPDPGPVPAADTKPGSVEAALRTLRAPT